jgi:antitoxin MazE
MQVNLTRWGNSLGLRIPKDLATRFRLAEGARVEMQAEGDRLIITMPNRFHLADLLEGITPESIHEAFDWGEDQGREAIE